MNNMIVLGKLTVGSTVEVDGVEYIITPQVLIRKDVTIQPHPDIPLIYDSERHIWVARSKADE